MKSLFLIFLVFITLPCWAGDGPQNSGRLNLKRSENFKIEATLQIDKKVALDPKRFLEKVSLISRGIRCDWSAPQMLSNDETLSAVSNLSCQHSPKTITIALTQLNELPPGFSLGVQTPFEHFSLTLENPSKETELSPGRFFFLSALKLGLAQQIQISKPYALSFGGLDFLPWGVWWGLLLSALALASVAPFLNILLIILSPFLVGFISYTLLAQEASLRYFAAGQLNLTFLAVSALLIGLSFLKKQQWILWASSFLTLLLMSLAGFEFAIILRWLEGNPQVSLLDSIRSFFLGLFSLNTVFGLGLFLLKKLPSSESFVFYSKLFLLGFSLYAGLALAFQFL